MAKVRYYPKGMKKRFKSQEEVGKYIARKYSLKRSKKSKVSRKGNFMSAREEENIGS